MTYVIHWAAHLVDVSISNPSYCRSFQMIYMFDDDNHHCLHKLPLDACHTHNEVP